MANAGSGRRKRRVKAGKEHLERLIAVKKFLSNDGRGLNSDELTLAYENVFPTLSPSEEDTKLREGRMMDENAVSTELGPDMWEKYVWLVSDMNFLDAGKRLHNKDPQLERHLWDVSYRTNLMGMPLETRQLALVHSLPEYRARGLEEAKKDCLQSIRERLGERVTSGLEASLLDWDGMLVDHLRYRIAQIGGTSSTSQKYLQERLGDISTKEERKNVSRIVDDVIKLSQASDKNRLVPIAVTEGDYIHPEMKARAHKLYVEKLFRSERRKLRRSGGKASPQYNCAPFLVKGLCLIDRLRTADGMAPIEKVTREVTDFLPWFDTIIAYHQQTNRVNNPLLFVSRALQAEFLTEMHREAVYYQMARDTAVTSLGDVLARRFNSARQKYAGQVMDLGVKVGGPITVSTEKSAKR